jgi:hypothetical protein
MAAFIVHRARDDPEEDQQSVTWTHGVLGLSNPRQHIPYLAIRSVPLRTCHLSEHRRVTSHDLPTLLRSVNRAGVGQARFHSCYRVTKVGDLFVNRVRGTHLRSHAQLKPFIRTAREGHARYGIRTQVLTRCPRRRDSKPSPLRSAAQDFRDQLVQGAGELKASSLTDPCSRSAQPI